MQSALIGLAALFVVVVVRSLPWVMRWAIDGRRPWACHACMSFWATLAVGVPAYRQGATWLEVIAGAGICYLGLRALDTRPPPLPGG